MRMHDAAPGRLAELKPACVEAPEHSRIPLPAGFRFSFNSTAAKRKESGGLAKRLLKQTIRRSRKAPADRHVSPCPGESMFGVS
jgi:hypothetical protein